MMVLRLGEQSHAIHEAPSLAEILELECAMDRIAPLDKLPVLQLGESSLAFIVVELGDHWIPPSAMASTLCRSPAAGCGKISVENELQLHLSDARTLCSVGEHFGPCLAGAATPAKLAPRRDL